MGGVIDDAPRQLHPDADTTPDVQDAVCCSH
jgi:hypothetical protein